MEVKERVWTWSDYLKLPSDKRYEIISGRLYEMPSPTVKHQRIVGKIFKVLSDYVEKNDLGEVFIAPMDVVLSEKDVVQPDVVFVKKENLDIVKDWIVGVPDLVVEVVSPGTLTRDTELKKSLYQAYGVEEFWVVFPEEKVVQVWVLEGEKFSLFSYAEIEGKIKSKILGESFDISSWF